MFCDQTVIWQCSSCIIDEAGLVRPIGTASKDGKTFLRRYNTSPVAVSPEIVPPVAMPDPNDSGGKTSRWERWIKVKREKNTNEVKGKHDEGQQKSDSNDLDEQLRAYFSDVVRLYNTRALTHTSDVPRAFQGIANYLVQNAPASSLFARGLSWGLPVAHMPHALTWCSSGEDLRPRDPSLGFPSWSWFAWEGDVSVDPVLPELELVAGFVPICKWDMVEDLSTPGSPSSSISPNAEGGGFVRLTTERCVLRLDYMGNGAVSLDQPEEFGRKSESPQEFLAISELVAAFRGGSPRKYVKALLIVRQEPRSATYGQHSIVYRRGVAILEREVWDRRVVKSWRPEVLMLA